MRRYWSLLLLLGFGAARAEAQGFCSDLSGPDLDRCREDYYASADAALTIVFRRALEAATPAAQSRLRQEQTAWNARRTRLAGTTRARPRIAVAKYDTLISVTEARINELGGRALASAPWLVAILPGGVAGGDSVAEAISMRNDVWRFAGWQEAWMHAGHTAYAGQDSIGSFRPTTGHAVTVLYAGEDGWSAIITSDTSPALCGMFRGDIDSQDPNLVEEGKVSCW
ncbi:MAG TPA: lysozyme inhibitor LprI family protein [Gemmatimonadales bacterium]|nr:lysozyme inhibitor LprI family protein [Gemmatimonadales bacterium]